MTFTLTPQLIRRQPDPESGCGLVAVQNLYVWARRDPPELAAMESHLKGQSYDLGDGTSAVMAFNLLLDDAGAPWRCALSFIPRGREARGVFAPLLGAGCALLVSFIWREGARYYSHAAVGVVQSDEGLTVLDSGGSADNGKTMRGFAYEEEQEAEITPEHNLPHGRVICLPWLTMPFDEWREASGTFRSGQREPAPLGISRDFLIVWPD